MIKYPIGRQNFKGIITEHCVYVDKTRYIAKLLDEGKYYFLARPRRFGKSLFISTLEYFFSGNRELFEGLSIYNYDWNWEPHPVIRLDMNGQDYTRTENSLIESLENALNEIAEKYDLKPFEGNVSTRLRNTIIQLFNKTGRQVVVLIDEYEKPILDNISNKSLRDHHKEILRGFYGVLKSLDEFLKLVFISGITKFGKMSVFSELNNLEDISLDPEYGAVCGITEEELTLNFQEGIQELAEAEFNNCQEALNALKENYDGYHFSEKCPDIYNPFSILNALKKKKIAAYWASTGTPKVLAELLVRNKRYNFDNLNGITVSEERLMDVRGEFDDVVTLLYQTGYLTIKKYIGSGRLYVLSFPNNEVEGAFSSYLIPYFMKPDDENSPSIIDDFLRGVICGNPEAVVSSLEAFTAGINYDLIRTVEVERHFQDMIYMFSRVLLPYRIYVKTEEHTSDGRIDLLIMTAEYIYIIEFKMDSTPEIALQQIEDKDYALQFRNDPRKVFLIGINFSSEKRRIDGFKIC